MTKGMKASESAVSVFFGGRHMQEGFGPRETWEEKMRRCLSRPRREFSAAHHPGPDRGAAL